MSRAFFILRTQADREQVLMLCRNAEWGTRIEFKAPRRTIPQNNKMWAMLTEISQQVMWHGTRLTTSDWKLLFLDALDREMRTVPSIDQRHLVNLGRLTSELSKEEMIQLIELIFAFGAEHSVHFRGDMTAEDMARMNDEEFNNNFRKKD